MPENDVKLTKLAKCAGCGAKVGAGVLAQLLDGIQVHRDPNLLVGFDKSDDASVYKVSDDLALVQTVDFFPPIADDPYLFGQIAATNALSDVYAMGGEPKLCLNIMAVPESMPKEAVHQLLRGGYDKVYEAGALITGGHSILDDEPKYGLAVTGFVHPDRVLTNSGARPGDVLLLTKPIGIGVLTTAQKAEMLSVEGRALAEELMTTLNKSARDAMVKYRVHACTDVTGFGLLGHSYEMAQGSDVELELEVDAIDLIPEALEFANMGLLPAGMYRNRAFAEAGVDAGETALCRQDLLYDPQTAGGLLMAVDPADAEAVAACRARAEEAFSKLNGSADPAHDFAVLAATYSDETDRDQHPSGYTFTVGDGTLPAACEEAAQALEEGQFSGVVEADDGFYLILRKHVDLEAVAPDYFDALLQAAADSADISTTRTYADLDVSRFYDELIAARAELDASGGEVA